jgi:hypothetical protein
MARHHTIISGTGRAGTTFLVQLLTALGQDTGFAEGGIYYDHCHAGFEWDIREPGAPYFVKSPFLCDILDEVMQSGEIVIEHALVPVRDLYSAAESRRHVVARTAMDLEPDRVPGGLWHTQDPHSQENVLLGKLYQLIYSLARHDIPVTLLHFPRFIHEPEYLISKLRPVLNGIDDEAIRTAFQSVCRPELVHSYVPPEGGQLRRAA